MKTIALLFVGVVFSYSFAQPLNQTTSNQLVDAYMARTYKLVQNTIGFSAPVSARAYMYISVGAFEGICHTRNTTGIAHELAQFQGFRNELKSGSTIESVVLNRIYYDLLSYFFRGASIYDLHQLQLMYEGFKKPYLADTSLVAFSDHIGQVIASNIIKWSKSDGGDEGYLQNFPEDYKIKSCSSCWVKTTPGYLPALLPHWGKNRTNLVDSRILVESFSTVPFSSDTNSTLYNEALAIVVNAKSTDREFERVAEYWDNAPGISGTPAGHFYEIAANLARTVSMEIHRKMEMYALLGVALNDAMITCWELKYAHNFIRPITYIQRHIDPYFNTRIDTPPFPESPSGHSFQSGAGGEILIAYFGDEIEWVDSTHVQRKDIDGSPVRFNRISDLMYEISLSRFYGGIHFRPTLDLSLDYGKRIGRIVLEKIKHGE
jgi:hypothetical protein